MSDYQPRAQGGWPAQPPASGYGPDYDAGYGPDNGPRYGPTARMPRRRRRRGRLIALAIVLVILLVIAGVADQVSRVYAQNRVAQKIEQQSQLNAKPSVSIEGWPFLTQIAAHDLKAVDISASNVTADTGKLPFSFTARATGVHLNSSFSGATVDHINGQAVVPFSSVASLFPVPVTLSADPADGPDAVKADAGIAGSVTGTVKQTGPGKITITLHSASGLGAVFSQLSSNAVTITIPQLPAGLTVKSVSVTSQGIVATASASNTTLTE